MKKYIFIIGIVVLLITGCSHTPPKSNFVNVPEGYILVGASEHGVFAGTKKYYIKEESGNRIFMYNGIELEGEVKIPSGFIFMAASAHGVIFTGITFYLKSEEGGKVLIYHP